MVKQGEKSLRKGNKTANLDSRLKNRYTPSAIGPGKYKN